jgi:hypothetical protein
LHNFLHNAISFLYSGVFAGALAERHASTLHALLFASVHSLSYAIRKPWQ